MKMNTNEKELTLEQEDLINDCHEKKLMEENEKLEKSYEWWKNLTEEEQLKIMTDYYPTEVKEDTDINKMFGDMPSDEQLWIYIRVTSKSRIKKTIYINPDRLDQILKRIGRKKLDDYENYCNLK